MIIPSVEYCNNLLNEYHVPLPIRRHCEAVTKTGVTVATHLKKTGKKVNITLVEIGGRLHDAFKAAAVKELKSVPHFNYIPSNFEKEYWAEIRKNYPKHTHETFIIADLLKNEYPEFSTFMTNIGSTNNPSYLKHGIQNDLELKILHYADWRVQFDQIISFDKRLEYLHEYWKRSEAEWEERIEQEKLLEHEIFECLEFTPDDLEKIVSSEVLNLEFA